MVPDKKEHSKDVELTVPIDASEIDDRSGLKRLKVLLVSSDGKTQSTEVKLDDKGKANAEFRLDRPMAGRVIVGPQDATDDELQGLQTLAADVPLRTWGTSRKRSF